MADHVPSRGSPRGSHVQLHGKYRGIPRHLGRAPAESHLLYHGCLWMTAWDAMGAPGHPRGMPWEPIGFHIICHGLPPKW